MFEDKDVEFVEDHEGAQGRSVVFEHDPSILFFLAIFVVVILAIGAMMGIAPSLDMSDWGSWVCVGISAVGVASLFGMSLSESLVRRRLRVTSDRLLVERSSILTPRVLEIHESYALTQIIAVRKVSSKLQGESTGLAHSVEISLKSGGHVKLCDETSNEDGVEIADVLMGWIERAREAAVMEEEVTQPMRVALHEPRPAQLLPSPTPAAPVQVSTPVAASPQPRPPSPSLQPSQLSMDTESDSGLLDVERVEDGSALRVTVYPMSQFKCVMRAIYFFLILAGSAYLFYSMGFSLEYEALMVCLGLVLWTGQAGRLFYLSLSYHTFTIRGDARVVVEETTFGVMREEVITAFKEDLRIDYDAGQDQVILNIARASSRTISMNMPLADVARLQRLLS